MSYLSHHHLLNDFPITFFKEASGLNELFCFIHGIGGIPLIQKNGHDPWQNHVRFSYGTA
ncbi:hypothetical protein ACQKL5_19225 [Peribacillus sp. NPDC097675]|uniref:hypothetical protein n=1 Tax=Peribacillus sp. NPDC097675 TaxID=3390618 RepID=UPI003D070148